MKESHNLNIQLLISQATSPVTLTLRLEEEDFQQDLKLTKMNLFDTLQPYVHAFPEFASVLSQSITNFLERFESSYDEENYIDYLELLHDISLFISRHLPKDDEKSVETCLLFQTLMEDPNLDMVMVRRFLRSNQITTEQALALRAVVKTPSNTAFMMP